jgi:TrmH family RNA methyltransferase
VKITSPSNPRVKAAAKLRSSRHRTEQGRFLIDGLREISRALDGKIAIDEVFVLEEQCSGKEAKQLLARLDRACNSRFEVSRSVYDVLAYGSRMEGIVAVGQIPHRSLADLDRVAGVDRRESPAQSENPGGSPASTPATRRPLVAVLEGVEKPGNVGAVLRSADGAGVSAVIVADGGSDLYNPNVIRSSMGTVFTMPICSASSAETIAWLRDRRLAIYAARVDGSVDYTACNFTGPCAIVLGSEAEGLTEAWRGSDITATGLPMLGVADSLNVSAAAAVLFYEAIRQRATVGCS